MLLLLCLCLPFLLFKKKWLCSIILLAVILLFNRYYQCFAIRGIINNQRSEGLKVLSWNVDSEPSSPIFMETMRRIGERILEVDADIVFLTEKYKADKDILYDMLREKYPYIIGLNDSRGNMILSKFNITSATPISNGYEDYSWCVSVNYQNDTLNICGCHLSSNNFYPDMTYFTPDEINTTGKIRDYLKNVHHAGELRVNEAKKICNYLNKTNIPAIVMGDMNDVCGSECMKVFDNFGFKDAWWMSGFGYGATFNNPLPYRIDHILITNALKVNQIEIVKNCGFSDHNGIFAIISVN